MAKTLSDLDGMMDQLEEDLPRLMLKYPDADGADFWIEFAQHSVVIETGAGTEHASHVRERLDRMLASRGLIAPDAAGEPGAATA